MAGELTVTNSIQYQKGSVGPFNRGVTAVAVDVAGNDGVLDFKTLSVAVAALSLGSVTGTLGWAWFHNTDATNNISILTGVAGVVFCTLKPGETAQLRLGSGITAPAAQAAGGTPVLEYLILPA